MKIVEKAIGDIKPYENNPRRNDAAVEYVANSIREFGWRVPIVISVGGEIVAGHTRYKAAQMLGIKKIPCIVADDLDEKQIKAYRLADNKAAEFADWDFSALAEELNELDNIDMGDFGFSEMVSRDNREVPDTFDKFDDGIEVEHKCPKCGYEW